MVFSSSSRNRFEKNYLDIYRYETWAGFRSRSSMVTGTSQEDEDKKLKGITRSWGTAVSGQSISTSGSGGSPSSRSEAGMATPARDSTVLRLSHLEIQGDDSASQSAVASKKKKRGQRAIGNDKSARGRRQFSMKVCEKMESKGRTTYNEVPRTRKRIVQSGLRDGGVFNHVFILLEEPRLRATVVDLF